MASPPHSPPCLQGASRMTEGILRGRALGNVYNFGDRMDVDSQEGKIMGKVHVYTTSGNPNDSNPNDSNPHMMLKHEVTNRLGPILKKLGNSYSPAKSVFIYAFIFFQYLMSIFRAKSACLCI